MGRLAGEGSRVQGFGQVAGAPGGYRAPPILRHGEDADGEGGNPRLPQDIHEVQPVSIRQSDAQEDPVRPL